MEPDPLDNIPRAMSSDSTSLSNVNASQQDELEDMDGWNPMVEDFTNKVFNDYKEPTTDELRQSMPKKGEKVNAEDPMAIYRSSDGDVRLFINGIPPDLTKEGIRGLFNQAGNVVYCKVIPLRDPNRKDTFGFVGYQFYREAEKAIRLFDGFSLGENMRLRVSLSKKKTQEIPSFGNSLPEGLTAMNGEPEGIDWDDQNDAANANNPESTVTSNGDHAIAMGDSNMDPMLTSTVRSEITMDAVAKGDENTTTMQDNNTLHQNGYLNEQDQFVDQIQNQPQSQYSVSTNGDNSKPENQSVSSNSNTPHVNDVGQKVTSKPQIPEAPCSLCGKAGSRRCGSCKIPYCSRNCQRTDWPEHKKDCTWKNDTYEAKQPEIEVKPPPKKDEPFVIDEDEMEISDPLGFMSHFGATVRQDVIQAIPPNAFDDSSRYLDSEASPRPLNGISHLNDSGKITEIQESVENEVPNEDDSRAFIEEVTLANDNERRPLIEEIVPSNVNTARPGLITENDSESTELQQPPPIESSSSTTVTRNPVHLEVSYPLIEEIVTFNGTDHLESKATLITEIPKPNDRQEATITEIPPAEVDSQGCRPQAPMITDITPVESASGMPPQPRDSTQIQEQVNQVEIHHRYRLADVPQEAIEVGKWYDVVVTSVSSPNVFWVQLFERESLEKQNALYEALTDLYTNSPYKNYVPMTGDVCVAQYTKDDNWYRCKVNYINNNGYINVTHIDFGSSEDIDVSRIRRITAELAAIPRQAIKCALDFPDGAPTECTLEMIESFRSKVLDIKCRVEVKRSGESIYYVDFYENDRKVNDMFEEQKKELVSPLQKEQEKMNAPSVMHEQPSTDAAQTLVDQHHPTSDSIPVTDTSYPTTTEMKTSGQQTQPVSQESQPAQTSIPSTIGKPSQSISNDSTSTAFLKPEQESQTVSKTPSVVPGQSPLPVLLDSTALTPITPPEQGVEISTVQTLSVEDQEQSLSTNPVQNPPVIDQLEQQDLTTSMSCSKPLETLSSSSSEQDLKTPLSPSSPKGVSPRSKFEAVVSSVVSPREFYVVLTDPDLIEKLDQLSSQLQEYCNGTPHDPAIQHRYGDVCLIRSDKDKEWYRGYVAFSCSKDLYSIQMMDIDAKEVVSTENIRPAPEWVKALPPRCLLCALGGITKRAGMTNFGKEAVNKFTSLVLNKKFMCKEIARKKMSSLVELFDESGQPSVARELINAGFADTFVKMTKTPQTNECHQELATMNISASSCRAAITSAKLPPPGQSFQATITQFDSPGHFFLHLKDQESQQKIDKICHDMNQHYAASSPPNDWQAREGQLCAAFFKSSWLRAIVKSITQDNVVTVFCVDFGNVEVVSNAALRPLPQQFSSLPHCALHCSLAYVNPPHGEQEWSKEAIDFVRMKLPLSSTLDVSLVYKGQTILFIEVHLPNKEVLTQLLVTKKLAWSHGKGSPNKEERFDKQKFHENYHQHSFKKGRESLTSWKKDRLHTPREMAISTAKLPGMKEYFKVIVTHIISPGCFSVQVADYATVSKVSTLREEMNTHYSSQTYAPYQAAFNHMCAAQFTLDGFWYRAWIEKVDDDKVHVYYPDYGNTEVLDVSRLRPLEPQFAVLPYAAITCSLGGVTAPDGWSKDAIEFFHSKIPLFESIDVKLVYIDSGSIFLTISDPQNQSATINSDMVAKNMAVWISKKKSPRREFAPSLIPNDVRKEVPTVQYTENKVENKRTDLTGQKSGVPEATIEDPESELSNSCSQSPVSIPETANQNSCTVNRNIASTTQTTGRTNKSERSQTTGIEDSGKMFSLESLPSVAVPHGINLDCMACDINPQGIVSLQRLTKDLEELTSLTASINFHCNQVDHAPYTPKAGELCFACFTVDKEWYRAVVNSILPNNQFEVTFVDYGNQDTVSLPAIRAMREKFLSLPRQAFGGPLKGLASSDEMSLADDIIQALKKALLDKHKIVVVDNDGVEFFNVGPDKQKGSSFNDDFIQIIYPNIPTEVDTEFAALVTEVYGTNEIWLQQLDLQDVIKSLMDDINLYCNKASPLSSPPSAGDLVFAKHSFYNSWYRAKVLKWSQSMADVLFVDHGYNEKVPLDHLCPPKADLLRLPFQAIKTYLVRVVQGNPEADDFIKQILNREFRVKIVEKKGEHAGVELEDYGVANGPLNMNDYLIGFGYEA